jgi:hypothetical protein
MSTTPFGFIEKPRQCRLSAQKFVKWMGLRRERFAYFVILSAFVHITLLGSLLIYHGTSKKPGDQTRNPDDFKAFREALRSINPLPDDPNNLASMLATVTDEDFNKGFSRAPQLDDRLTFKERAAIFKTLISRSTSRHEEKANAGSADKFTIEDLFSEVGDLEEIRAPDGNKLLRYGSSAGSGSKYYKLSQESERRLQTFNHSDQHDQRTAVSGNINVKTENGPINVPAEYFYRQIPYEQILAIGARLYYFAEGFPVLGPPREKSPEGSRLSSLQKTASTQSNRTQPGVSFIFVQSARTDNKVINATLPASIDLKADHINQILDNLIEYSDEEQFEKFSRDYLQKYDPDNNLLASLTREFIYRNLGTVFILTDPLSTGFDFLEGIFYRKLSMEKFISYYLDNRNTKTGAEVLFCLAAYYDFERRSLSRLQESMGVVEKALSDPAYPLDVFDMKAKAFVLQQIHREVASEIQTRGYSSLEGVLQQYREQQARIYDILINMGGEIKDKALYSLGALYWDEARVDMAIKTWKKISSNYNASPFSKIRGFIALDEPDILGANIARVIDDEAIANKREMVERMDRFHKWDKRSPVRSWSAPPAERHYFP